METTVARCELRAHHEEMDEVKPGGLAGMLLDSAHQFDTPPASPIIQHVNPSDAAAAQTGYNGAVRFPSYE